MQRQAEIRFKIAEDVGSKLARGSFFGVGMLSSKL